MRYMGIDWGTKRIGVAVSDEQGTIAFPLTTVPSGAKAATEIAQLVKAHGVESIVLGESKDLSGGQNAIMPKILEFMEALELETGLPVLLEPEFMTSSQAAYQFAPDGSRKKNPSHANLDASAAALILQSYLDKNRR